MYAIIVPIYYFIIWIFLFIFSKHESVCFIALFFIKFVHFLLIQLNFCIRPALRGGLVFIFGGIGLQKCFDFEERIFIPREFGFDCLCLTACFVSSQALCGDVSTCFIMSWRSCVEFIGTACLHSLLIIVNV